MEETKSKNNGQAAATGAPVKKSGSGGGFLVGVVKFLLFWVVFCFLIEFGRAFLSELSAHKDISLNPLFIASIAAFFIYNFIADLNDVYKTIQQFFSHSTMFGLLLPFLLLIIGVGYLIIPRLFNLAINTDIFLFVGGFIMTCHMMYIAKQSRGDTFAAFSHYLLIMSVLVIINIVFFTLYLSIIYKMNTWAIIVAGSQNGYALLQNTFLQLIGQSKAGQLGVAPRPITTAHP